MTPHFSVLVPAFNAELTLGETLDSLLAQTYTGWQAVVVDDGSSDGTFALATEYARRDTRIVALTQPNGGTAVARNTAAAHARAPWLLALDADDMLLPPALERQAAFMEAHPGFDVYSWALLLQGPDGTRALWPVSARHAEVASYSLAQLIEASIIPAVSVISASLFSRLGGYREVFLEDYDLWLRALAAGGKHLHNPEPLAVYRVNVSSKNVDAAKRAESAARILEDLSATPGLAVAERAAAQRAAGVNQANVARLHLESRLDAGDFAAARALFVKARRAYPNPLRRLAAAAVMAVSPRLFARIAPRSHAQAVNVEIPPGMALGEDRRPDMLQ